MKYVVALVAALTFAGCGGASASRRALTDQGVRIQACLRDRRGFQEVAIRFPSGTERLFARVKFGGPSGVLEGAATASNSSGLIADSEGGPVRGHFTCQITQVDSYGKKSDRPGNLLGTGGPQERHIGGAGPVVAGMM
jgi:hypothetical protein